MKVILLSFCLSLLAGLVSTQDTRVTAFGSIEGVVRDLNGTPIPMASVYAFHETDFTKRIRTTADTNGKFALQNVPIGTVYVHAYKESDGYPDAFFSFFSTNKNSWQTVRVESGRATSNVVIELGPKYATLDLVIQNENGEPVGATLTFVRDDDPSRPYSLGSNSRLSLLVPPVPFRLKVEAKGYEPWDYKATRTGRVASIRPQSGQTVSVIARLKKAR